MKKYTILLSSDSEDEKSEKCEIGVNKSHCIEKRQSSPSPLEMMQRSEEAKVEEKNPSTQSSFHFEEIVEDLKWDQVRTPSIKSDEEISYWITTSKAPCLYYHDRDITSSLMLPNDFITAEDGHAIKPKDNTSSNKQTFIVNGKSYDVPKYIPSNSNNHGSKKDIINNMINMNHENKSHDALNSYSNDLLELSKESSIGRNIFKRSVDDIDRGNYKCKVNKHTQPLDDYDSGSSVLTINYIKYVNNQHADNLKQSKRKRPHLSGVAKNLSTTSLNYLKHSKSLSKDSGCASQDKYSNILDYSISSNLKPLCEKSTTKCKKLYHNNSLLKSSFEDTQQLNNVIFDNSKTSTSSIENTCNNNSSNFFKHSQKNSLNSNGKLDLLKLAGENISDQSGAFCVSTNSSMSKSLNCLSQTIYTKIETVQYITEYPNTNQSPFDAH